MNHPTGMASESRRAIEELGAAGMRIYTNIKGQPLDHPNFEAFFEYMNESGKPIWMHPARGQGFADYQSEDRSEYEIWWTFGWPYETSAAMARLVFSEFLIAILISRSLHTTRVEWSHFLRRVGPGWDQMGKRTSDRDLGAAKDALRKPHLQYFKEFYADTASFGSKKAIEHALEFFSEDRIVFASDAPFDPEGGPMYIRETINAIDAMELDTAVKEKLFYRNACELMGID